MIWSGRCVGSLRSVPTKAATNGADEEDGAQLKSARRSEPLAFARIHLGTDSAGTFRPSLARLAEQADVFLVAGDLTKRGTKAEAAAVSEELGDLPVPTFAVLGNHDYESDCSDVLSDYLQEGGVAVLEGNSAYCHVDGVSIGIAGVKGFGGGFTATPTAALPAVPHRGARPSAMLPYR